LDVISHGLVEVEVEVDVLEFEEEEQWFVYPF
jgi:hypothetical protein